MANKESLDNIKHLLDKEVSFFKNSFDKKPVLNDTIGKYFNTIKYGTFADRISRWRKMSKAIKQGEKMKLPSVIMSGVFTGRKDRDIVPGSYTNIIVLDLDWKDNFDTDLSKMKDRLIMDKHVLCVHFSVSGEGLAIYVYTSVEHKQYRFIREAYEKAYGIALDSSTNNVGRLRYISHDKDLLINTSVEPYSKIVKVKRRKANVVNKKQTDFNTVKFFVEKLAKEGSDITSGYENWYKIGIALSTFGEKGRELFHTVSSVNEEYDVDKTDSKYDKILEMEKPMVNLTILWHLKKQL